MTWDWVFDTDSWEWASYVVTVFALPFGIAVFVHEQRRERQNEDEELYQRLSDEYAEFCQLLLTNADLRLMTQSMPPRQMNEEQAERRNVLFDILISLLERAYILVYEEKMNEQTARLWASWDDYIRFWCRRDDFRSALPGLLEGEDVEFGNYIRKIAQNPERPR